MNSNLSAARRLFRRLSCLALPPILILLGLATIGLQFRELSSRSEILSLSSFVVLLSFSALAFNWSRVSSEFVSAKKLHEVYEAAVDFFVASLLALVSAMFTWLQGTPNLAPLLWKALFGLHWLFLLGSIVLLLVALLALLRVVAKSDE